MKEYIFKNIADKSIYPFIEFEIRLKAMDDMDAWKKLIKLLDKPDISHCVLTNSDKN